MTRSTAILTESNAGPWDKAVYAFLAEKQRRSGSNRTVQGYSGMLRHFFGTLGKTPELVTSEQVFTWAYSPGLSGLSPSSTTIGARIACLSSFFRFLIRMQMVTANPCDKLDRPKARASTPRGLSADEIRRLLDVIPDTKVGLRDTAIILTLVFTGRRRAEVLGLTAGNITREGNIVYYNYRGKGGKTGRRELPLPAFQAIQESLTAWAKSLETMTPDESLWPSGAKGGQGLSSGTFYGHLQRYLEKAGLPPSGVHVFRHSAAKLRREVGESVESVSSFLDHSSLAVTSIYLKRLEGQEDKSWGRVAEAIGI